MSYKGETSEYEVLSSIGFDTHKGLELIQSPEDSESVQNVVNSLEETVNTNALDNPVKLVKLGNELIHFHNIIQTDISDESKKQFKALVRSCVNKLIELDKVNKDQIAKMSAIDLSDYHAELKKLVFTVDQFDKRFDPSTYLKLSNIYFRTMDEKNERPSEESVNSSDTEQVYYSESRLIEGLLGEEDEFTETFETETETYKRDNVKSSNIESILRINYDNIGNELEYLKNVLPQLKDNIVDFNREEKVQSYKSLLKLDSYFDVYLSNLTRSPYPDNDLIQSVTAQYLIIKELYDSLAEELRTTSSEENEQKITQTEQSNIKKMINDYDPDLVTENLQNIINLGRNVDQIIKSLGLNEIENEIFSHQVGHTELLTLSLKLKKLNKNITDYRSSLTFKEKRLLKSKKKLDVLQSRLTRLEKECVAQARDIERIRVSCSKFDSNNFNELLNTTTKYNPENITPHDRSIARNISRKLGLRTRLSFLKRKIYKAQILGSENDVIKYRNKVNSYSAHLKNIVNEQKNDTLKGVIRSEIDYAEKIVGESLKPLKPALKSQRVNRLFLRNPKRKISERIAANIEKLHLGNSELYEKSKKADSTTDPNQIINIFEMKVKNLMSENYQLLHAYNYVLYLKFKKDRGMAITKSESAMIEKLPEIIGMVFNSGQFLHSNIDASQLEAALRAYVPTESSDIVIDPVYNLLASAKNDNLQLSEQSAFDIIRGTRSIDQDQINRELKSFINENAKINKIKLNKLLVQLANLPEKGQRKKFQQLKAKNLQKNIANLLGLRELNNLLASEATLNTALSDKYTKLADIQVMSENYSHALNTFSQNLSTDLVESNLQPALAEVINAESIVATAVANQVNEAKQIMHKRQIHTVEEVPLSTAIKASIKLKRNEYPPSWTEETQRPSKKERKDSDNSSVPPPKSTG